MRTRGEDFFLIREQWLAIAESSPTDRAHNGDREGDRIVGFGYILHPLTYYNHRQLLHPKVD